MFLSKDPNAVSKSISPFWYGRVIGIFHVEAGLKSAKDVKLKRFDLLWVRWFKRCIEVSFGDDACRLERVRFVSEKEGPPQFGFIDPANVIRGAHLIPAFHYGRTSKLLRPSILARVKEPDDQDTDWEYFYVNK